MSILSLVKSNVSMFDLAKEYVNDFEEKGSYQKGTCPFCTSCPTCSHKSFTVSMPRQIFYCFKCNVGGDQIEFISQLKLWDADKAAQYLAEKYNIDISNP
jgi:DNA primase